ncbi:uncharacterized protein LOC106642583 [Copidosoma floridanum]|uniref:uncharacterized protein LOC106642583 n=1 Tax=Copidosoma floridanum TaxID=29053 RepID=UPI0006C9E0CB|nr:uncharacterized protein LOC106642583 [Copidosoma floridanum]
MHAEISHYFTCKRYKSRTQIQLMGDLLDCRLTSSPPFHKTGVDYAGPFPVRLSKCRGKGTLKGHIVVFVSIATKTTHLEIVEHYLTESFIAAFQRFVSRRDHCTDLYSDQGTNFVRADHDLRKMLKDRHQSDQFADNLSSLGTQWNFNQPAALHFGGIWESAVKSTNFI